MRREKNGKNSVGVSTWRNVHAGETIDKAGFAWVLTSTDCSNPGASCPRWDFNRKFYRWILHVTKQLSALSNMTRGKGLVITILTRNLTSTPQGLDIAKDALITFCFTRVSCDIQIIRHPVINDIKCASKFADCVPWNRSATVIDIRILLKATSCFLHNFIMFGSSLPAYF